MNVRQLVANALRRDPARIAMEFKAQPISCAQIAAIADAVVGLLQKAAIPQETPIAVAARNRPAIGATILGLIEAGRTVSNIYAFQPAAALAADLTAARFAVLIAEERDWTAEVIDAAKNLGILGIALGSDGAASVDYVPGLERPGRGPFRQPRSGPGIEILSSGTTGAPKRIAIPESVLVRSIESIRGSGFEKDAPPDLMGWPLAGIGGMCCLVADFAIERLLVLLEKFSLPEWLEGFKRHRPATIVAPPALARAILDARLPKSELAGLQYYYGGSAHMPPEMQEEFEATYGVKIMWAYGATEFCGTVLTWTPDLHARFSKSKRGAMGRPFPGIQVRIVDPETGLELPRGQEGHLEALSPMISREWIRTTDLAVMDEDDFVFHRGRADGVIVRGGFKIAPEKIDNALREHPSILDAATVGVADERLGSVPGSVIELRRGAGAPTPRALDEHVRSRLNPLHVPVRYLIVDAIPRTTSMKADLRAVRALLEDSNPARAGFQAAPN
jgi:long-chain acyl-CoA synthetase